MRHRLRPFAEILNMVDALTDDQRADLLDYLRGKQPKKERKVSKKPEKEKTEKPAKVEMCVTCGNEATHFDHTKDSDVYHIFRTSLKSKAATESK